MAILAGQRVLASDITLATNPPLFSGYATATQSIPNNVFTGVDIDTAVVDTETGHSASSNPSRYTCQVAGWYYLSGLVVFGTTGTGLRGAGFSLNGSTTVINGSENLVPVSASTATTIPAVPVVVQLDVGDYVSLAAFQNSGSALSNSSGVGGARNSFTAKFVSL